MSIILNTLLAPVSFLYKTISLLAWHHKRRHARIFPGLFIISVDNLTFGGSGKTTLVRHLGTRLQQNQIPFAIVSRGYKSAVKHGCREIFPEDEVRLAGDEALLLRQQFPQTPVFIGPDRIASLEHLAQGPRRVVLLDDGFQSAHIRKDLSLLLITPEKPAYFHRNFAFMARRCDYALTFQPDTLPFETHPPAPARYRFRHQGLYNLAGQQVKPAQTPLVIFSALGDNRRFARDMASYCVKEVHAFADHHFFTPEDIDKIKASMQRHGAAYGVCTRKDFVKLPPEVQSDPTFLYAENTIELNFDLFSSLLTTERFRDHTAPSS
jgi:tetraacyldisaccharide 4'-kinase